MGIDRLHWWLKKMANCRYTGRLWLLPYRVLEVVYGSSIGYKAEIAGKPCYPHSLHGIFISGAAKLGKDCVIFQQVTIGSNMLEDTKKQGAPVIGDRCYIGAGAKIIGAIVIGNDVRIGANAVVHKDVPDNSVVVSFEQKTVKKTQPQDNRFFRNNGAEYYADGRWVKAE